jgi:hypothetical protein
MLFRLSNQYAACMREWRGAYKVLVGKLEAKMLLGRHRYKWKNNIKLDL